MKPVKFPEQNVTFAEDQPEFIPLPAHRGKDGTVVSCWALSWRDRLRILWTGRIWLGCLTFNAPPQPVWLVTERPFVEHP